MTHPKELIEAMVDAVEQLTQPKRGEPDCVVRTLPPWHVVMAAALDAHAAYLETNGLVIVPRDEKIDLLKTMLPSLLRGAFDTGAQSVMQGLDVSSVRSNAAINSQIEQAVELLFPQAAQKEKSNEPIGSG